MNPETHCIVIMSKCQELSGTHSTTTIRLRGVDVERKNMKEKQKNNNKCVLKSAGGVLVTITSMQLVALIYINSIQALFSKVTMGKGKM